MKTITGFLAASALVLAIAGPAFAQAGVGGGFNANLSNLRVPGEPGASDFSGIPGAGMPNQAAWNHYLQTHPKAAAELRANPNAMYDPAWQARHPQFQEFMSKHPGDWKALRQEGSKYYDSKFSGFLDKHPKMATDLRNNPSLLYDPKYRREHPRLTEYMADHPNVWHSLKENRPTGPGNVPPGQAVSESRHERNLERRQAHEQHREEVHQGREQHREERHQYREQRKMERHQQKDAGKSAN